MLRKTHQCIKYMYIQKLFSLTKYSTEFKFFLLFSLSHFTSLLFSDHAMILDFLYILMALVWYLLRHGPLLPT